MEFINVLDDTPTGQQLQRRNTICSSSLPRMNSQVLTSQILDDFARAGEKEAVWKRQYEQAYRNLYGTNIPKNTCFTNIDGDATSKYLSVDCRVRASSF